HPNLARSTAERKKEVLRGERRSRVRQFESARADQFTSKLIHRFGSPSSLKLPIYEAPQSCAQYSGAQKGSLARGAAEPRSAVRICPCRPIHIQIDPSLRIAIISETADLRSTPILRAVQRSAKRKSCEGSGGAAFGSSNLPVLTNSTETMRSW